MKVKKILSWVIPVLLIIILLVFLNKFFWSATKIVTHFDSEFTLSDVYDYAKVGDEVTVKLMKIEDNRCLEDTCEREGQMVAEFLVTSDYTFEYIRLGTLADTNIDITKTGMGYNVELIEINDDYEVTLKVTKLED